MLPLGQRRKVEKVYLLVGKKRWRRQKSLQPIFVPLLFHSGNTICLKAMSQISLVLFFSLSQLFLLFSPCLFFQSFLLCYFCLFAGLTLKVFLFFLLAKQGFRLSIRKLNSKPE